MEELRRIYRQALAGRVEALEAAISVGSAESAETIRRVAHSLRGSGGTYGFPEISSAAAEVEVASAAELPAKLDALLSIMRAAARPAAAKQRILVVDDDPELLLLLRAILASATREIVTAETYAEAVERIDAGSYSLVLLDLFLPDGDGRSLLLKIRERPATADVPVIVLSATSAPHAKAECFALGADLFFEKPFDPETVAAAAADRLRRSGRARDALQDPESGFLNRLGLRQAYATAAASQGRRLMLLEDAVAADSGAGPDAAPGGALQAGLRSAAADGAQVARISATRYAILATGSDPLPTLERFTAADGEATLAGAAIDAPPDLEFDDALGRAEALLHRARQGTIATESDVPPAGRILLVEDDDLVASILRHRLAREGFEVMHAADGESAWQLGHGGGFDIIILDVKIPVMDGFQLLERFRTLPALKTTRIVMLTAIGGEHDIVRALEIGADDYIVKPFSPVEVVARIQRLIGRR